MAIRIHRDKNMLAYMGEDKQLVRVLTTTKNGAVVQCELVDEPGKVLLPPIKNGKNVDKFIIIGEQTSFL